MMDVQTAYPLAFMCRPSRRNSSARGFTLRIEHGRVHLDELSSWSRENIRFDQLIRFLELLQLPQRLMEGLIDT